VINFLIIGFCLATGVLLQRKVPPDAYKAINAWLIYLALPAVSFKYLPHVQFSPSLLVPALAPVVVWLGGWLYSRWYARRHGLSAPTEGALKLSTGLSNTSFVGFPLVAAYFGEAQIGVAIISDQVTFLLLSTAAIVVGIRSSGKHRLSAATVLRKVFSFPAVPAAIAALTLPRSIDLSFFDPLFHSFAATVAPLALFSIGLQLRLQGWRKDARIISAALLYKLVLAPALVLGLVLLLGQKGMEARIGIFEAAMPTLVSSAIVAGEYGLNPRLSSLVIGVGILACFVTTALWFLLIRALV
jgi:predicted permease